MWLFPFANHSAARISTIMDTPETGQSPNTTDAAQQQLQPIDPAKFQLSAIPTSGSTLLPSAIASLISKFSKSTTYSIQLSSLIGQLIIDSARTTTLSSLELARAGIEGVLLRAYQDVEARRVARGRDNSVDQGWTESMLTNLHATITFSQLLISTGFEASATGLNAVKELSQGWIYVIDSIFGETESSRAINSILTLIIQQFGTAEHKNGEASVGVFDLLAGLACFAILQKRGRRRRTKEITTEIIWDVVVGDFGSSVIRSRDKTQDRPFLRSRRPSLVKLGGSVPSVQNHHGLVADKDEAWTMVRGDNDMSCSDESDYSYASDAGTTGTIDPALLSKDELATWLRRLPP